MSYNILDVMKDELLHGHSSHVSKNVWAERLLICQSCSSLKKNVIYTCGECGCLIKSKTLYRGSSCPLNKWKEEQ